MKITLLEELNQSDKKEVKSILKREVEDVLEKELIKALGNKNVDREVKKIVANALADFFKTLYTRKQFWANNIK